MEPVSIATTTAAAGAALANTACAVANFVAGQTGALTYTPGESLTTLTPDRLEEIRRRQGGTLRATCVRYFMPFRLARRSSLHANVIAVAVPVAGPALRLAQKITEKADADRRVGHSGRPLAEKPVGELLTNGEWSDVRDKIVGLKAKFLIPLQVECEVISFPYTWEGQRTTEHHLRTARVTRDSENPYKNMFHEAAELSFTGTGFPVEGASGSYARFDWTMTNAGRKLRSSAKDRAGAIRLNLGADGKPGAVLAGSSLKYIEFASTVVHEDVPLGGAVQSTTVTQPTRPDAVRQQDRTLDLDWGRNVDARGVQEALRRHVKLRFGVRLSDAEAQADLDNVFGEFRAAEWLLFLAVSSGLTEAGVGGRKWRAMWRAAGSDNSEADRAEIVKRMQDPLDAAFADYRKRRMTNPTHGKSDAARAEAATTALTTYLQQLDRMLETYRSTLRRLLRQTSRADFEGTALDGLRAERKRILSTVRAGCVAYALARTGARGRTDAEQVVDRTPAGQGGTFVTDLVDALDPAGRPVALAPHLAALTAHLVAVDTDVRAWRSDRRNRLGGATRALMTLTDQQLKDGEA